MWFHDHDLDGNLHHADVLFLYREPVATVYSNLMYDRRHAARSLLGRLCKTSPASVERAAVIRCCDRYRRHCEKWLLPGRQARTVIRHENFLTRPADEFAKICAHFGRSLDTRRMEQAFALVTPEALATKAGDSPAMGSHMLGKEYQVCRREFARQWGDLVRQRMVTPALQPFFPEIMPSESPPRSVAGPEHE